MIVLLTLNVIASSVMELDRLLGRYDAEFWRPAGFNLRQVMQIFRSTPTLVLAAAWAVQTLAPVIFSDHLPHKNLQSM